MVRFKNRYLLLEARFADARTARLPEAVAALEPISLLNDIRRILGECFGDLTLGQELASLQIKFSDAATGLVVLRCSRANHRRVWCAVTMLTSLKHIRVTFRVLHASATARQVKSPVLKALEKRLAHLNLAARTTALQDASTRLASFDV